MIGNIFKQSIQSISNNLSSYYISKMEVKYVSRQNVYKLCFSQYSGYTTINQFLRLINCPYEISYFFPDGDCPENTKSWKRKGLDLIKISRYPISYPFANAISNESLVITRYIVLFQRKIREIIRKRKYREIFLLQVSLLHHNIHLPIDILRNIYTYL